MAARDRQNYKRYALPSERAGQGVLAVALEHFVCRSVSAFASVSALKFAPETGLKQARSHREMRRLAVRLTG